jgi:hypothetical protein
MVDWVGFTGDCFAKERLLRNLPFCHCEAVFFRRSNPMSTGRLLQAGKAPAFAMTVSLRLKGAGAMGYLAMTIKLN